MSELPRGWVEVKLSDFAEINPGRLGNVAPDILISFVPMPAVSDTEGEIVNPTVRPYSEVSKGYTQFREGDVIFAKITPCMENGKIAVARSLENGMACGSTEFHVVRPLDGILPDFIWRYLRQESFRRDAEASMTGAVGQRRVPASFLKERCLYLPPLPEQRRIVAKIDSLTAKSKRARDRLAHIPRLVEKYKQAVLTAAFRGDLTKDISGDRPPLYDTDDIDSRAGELEPLPSGWCWTSIISIGQVTGGLTKNAARKSIPLQVSYLRVANVYANELRLSDISEIGCTEAEYRRTALQAGDLLVVEGNGSLDQIGRVALWNNEVPGCSHQNHIIRISLNEDVIPKFALFWLLSPGGRAAIEAVASSSSGLHTLSISKVCGLPIPVCSVLQQTEIVHRIESTFPWIDRIAADAAGAAKLIDHLNQAMLAKAFYGKLVPQDPMDEPASVLLKCIRAGRVIVPKSKRDCRKVV
jgi:type I restriction enzyme S subunit